MNTQARLHARCISVRYGNFHALHQVSVEFRAGEVHAVVGQNGAGKSTLMRVLAGEERPLEGELALDGRVMPLRSPMHARECGISIVHQHFELAQAMTVAQNMSLGQVPTRGRWLVDHEAMKRRARERLAPFGLSDQVDTLVRDLPMAERQLVEISRALGEQAQVLILDEPTAALSHEEAERLFETVKTIRKSGGCVILIAHNLDEVLDIADRITVLRSGKLVATVDRHEVDRSQLVRLMIGRELDGNFPSRGNAYGSTTATLAVGGVVKRADGEYVDLSLRPSEILGVPTYVGSAVEEIIDVINGERLPDGAKVTYRGVNISSDGSRQRILNGICTVPGDALKDGVIPQMSIAENIALANRRRLGRAGWLDRSAMRRLTQDLIQELDIRPANEDSPVGLLSGGNRQKVVIAKWMASSAKVLLMDDPTKAVDVAAKADIYRLTRRVASDGAAVLFLSTDMDELLGLCDRTVLLHQRRLLGSMDYPPFDKAELMKLITARRRNPPPPHHTTKTRLQNHDG